ncbi:DNA-directed RNA polymerase specialized sigma24 family protein [Arthrobacter sp. CAN_A2]|uniref:hypothetical protein n=1 Tax=Arthrobacter sp. CAN_A2 TaxID=2787718 RepID=UPI0018EFE195
MAASVARGTGVGRGWDVLDDDGDLTALHDAAYRYAFRRSLSARLASSAAQEAVESLGAGPVGPPDPDDDRSAAADADTELVAALRATRTALERYLPTTLPPRVLGDASLRTALADRAPADRELLLLHHWDGLPVEDAARMTGGEAARLPAIESACARGALSGAATATATTAGPEGASAPPGTDFAAALAAADPASAITGEDLARSRCGLAGAAQPTVEQPVPAAVAPVAATLAAALSTVPAPSAVSAARAGLPRFPTRAVVPGRQVQAILGVLCLLAVMAGLTTALIPHTTPGPAGDAERLYALADVVAVVSVADLVPTQVDGDLRMLQAASVVQIVKGDAEGSILTIDVTGRSTLERPVSRNLFTPDQLMFLVRDGDGFLLPIEGEGSVLTLIDRRSPEATTMAGNPAPLPDELRDAIHALPAEELQLDTNGTPPGSLPAESIVGVRPAEGRNVQNLPADRLGEFHVLPAGDGRACVVFEYNGREVLLRWPEGFSAYEREEVLSYPDEDPRRGRQVLTVLNDRGYPYVDENRWAPFIGGAPTGGRGECGGQELEVWDIAVEPGTTLLSY